MRALPEYIDILIIGAGQAGLAFGHYVRMTGHTYLLTERHNRIGDSWRNRYDSLVLFTTRSFSGLPGLSLPGDPDMFPGKDEIADYLERYARLFNLPVETGISIVNLARSKDGFFVATVDDGQTIRARAVVMATGALQIPAIPDFAKSIPESVTQLNSVTYRSPSQIPPGPVLVVGDGATGRQIANELAAGHEVTLSTGHRRRTLPNTILGKSVFWWLDAIGLGRASKASFWGNSIMKGDAFPEDLQLSVLEARGVQIQARLTGVADNRMFFANQDALAVRSVIWTTGYLDHTEWVNVPEAKDSQGKFVESRGVSPVPGLYFIGRKWQTSRGSALLMGVGHDALEICEALARWFEQSPRITPLARYWKGLCR